MAPPDAGEHPWPTGDVEPQPREEGPVRRSWSLMTVAWIGALVAWILAAIRPDSGRVAIVLGVTFVLALAGRFVYLRLFLRRNRPWRVWSPWLFVVAASLGVLSFGAVWVAEEHNERNDRLSGAGLADWRQGCLSGGIQSYDALPADHPTRLALTRAEMLLVLDRFCTTAADEGYAVDRSPTEEEQVELQQLMQDVLAEMESEGELGAS